MATEVGKLSLRDTLRFQWHVGVLAALWGLAAPNRFFVERLVRWNTGARTARFLADLRQKYRSSYLRLWFPWSATLLVMDPQGIDAVLASSDNAADPDLKRRTLSQFVPDSLVVSSGTAWRERRTFNESALQFGERLHRDADAFVAIIDAEVARFAAESRAELGFADFEHLAERIAHQVLMGRDVVDLEMTALLAKVVKRSNGYALPRAAAAFSAFYRLLDAHLARHGAAIARGAPAAPCLMGDAAALVAGGHCGASASVSTQVGFWCFVIKDALEINVPRTLALIAAHSEVYRNAQQDVDAMPAFDAKSAAGLAYLEGCLREQLRLWTPVPLLLRRVVADFELPGGVALRAGEKIMIHAGFYHRDPMHFGAAADTFAPTATSALDAPRLYSFSAGRQSCAGQFVARFLLTATLAALLKRMRFELIGPAIATGGIPHQYDHFAIRLRAGPRS
jgi:cytochrome P450